MCDSFFIILCIHAYIKICTSVYSKCFKVCRTVDVYKINEIIRLTGNLIVGTFFFFLHFIGLYIMNAVFAVNRHKKRTKFSYPYKGAQKRVHDNTPLLALDLMVRLMENGIISRDLNGHGGPAGLSLIHRLAGARRIAI